MRINNLNKKRNHKEYLTTFENCNRIKWEGPFNYLRNEKGSVKSGVAGMLVGVVAVGGVLCAVVPGTKDEVKQFVLKGVRNIEEKLDPPQVIVSKDNDVIVEKKVRLDMSTAKVIGVSKDVRAEIKDIKEHFYMKEVNAKIDKMSNNRMVKKVNETLTKRVSDEIIFADAILGYNYGRIINSPEFRENFAVADTENKTITISTPPLEVLYVVIDCNKTINNIKHTSNEVGILVQKDSEYDRKKDAIRQKEIQKKIKERFNKRSYKDTKEREKFVEAELTAEQQAIDQYKLIYCNGDFKDYEIVLKAINPEDFKRYEEQSFKEIIRHIENK